MAIGMVMTTINSDQGAVAGELAQPHLAVDGDAQLGGLAGLAQQRNFVDGQRLVATAGGVDGDHGQRMDDSPLGGVDPLQQRVFAVLVHQETD